MTTIYQLLEQSDLTSGQFIRAVNHIIGGTFNAERFYEFLNGKRGFSDRAMENLEYGATTLVNEVLPLHDALMGNEAYANMNPLVVAFANAVDADPQVMADYEWLVAAREADEKLKLISHDIFGLTLVQR